MANNDKIYEAYIGLRGEEQQEKTRQRINWILEEVGQAKKVLDVGCSQGIISLLIAQQGKEVLGIDVQKEAIEYAQQLLDEEYKECSDKVEFICTDFMAFEKKEKYDCIIVTEVLEHLEDPSAFLQHTKEFLEDDGKLIISVPFGVSDHPDHRSTFYLSNFTSLVEENFQINKVIYMGRWIGIIADSHITNNKFAYSFEEIKREEANFCEIDWEMTKRIQSLYDSNMEMSEKYKQALENYSKIKEEYGEVLEKRKQALENYDAIKEKYAAALENYDAIKEKYIVALENYETTKRNYNDVLINYRDVQQQNNEMVAHKKELTHTIQELYGEVTSVVEVLKANKSTINRLQTQNNYLKHENEELKRKLSLITDTFIGKIGIKGYKLLKKLKRKFK